MRIDTLHSVTDDITGSSKPFLYYGVPRYFYLLSHQTE